MPCVRLSATIVAMLAWRAAAAPNISLLVHASDARTWFGSVAIAMAQRADPILMVTSWVFPPEELVAYRPTAGAGAAWRVDSTSVMTYQTLYIASSGSVAPSSAVDALAFWNEKPGGIIGTCSLIGFNSQAAPSLNGSGSHVWRASLSTTCGNINGWTPFTRHMLSSDGSTAVAWVQAGNLDVTVYAFDGQTGKPRWTRTFPAPPPPDDQYFDSLGVELSADGKWVVVDEGLGGGSGIQRLHVLSAVDGTPRCGPVGSPAFMQGTLSADGAYLLSLDNDQTGVVAVHRFNATTVAYDRIGQALPPLDAPSSAGWQLGAAALTTDAAGKTFAGLAWFDGALAGSSLVAMFDVENMTTPAVVYAVAPVAGDDIAVASTAIECDGGICVAGFWCQVVNGTQPTVAVISPASPATPLLAFTSPGSVDAVDIVSAGAGVYYISAAGCSTYGVCTDPGSDAYLWRLQM